MVVVVSPSLVDDASTSWVVGGQLQMFDVMATPERNGGGQTNPDALCHGTMTNDMRLDLIDVLFIVVYCRRDCRAGEEKTDVWFVCVGVWMLWRMVGILS